MQYTMIVCPKCNLSFKQESKFMTHLGLIHEITDAESFYVETHLSGVTPTCKCSIECNEPVRWGGWKKGYTSEYIRGHNARVMTVFSDPEIIKRATKKRLKGLTEGRCKVWNDGLTKESDPRIALSAAKISATLNEGYSTGRLSDWRPKYPEKAALQAKRMSETKKLLFATGEFKSWNEGLTKENNEQVARTAELIRAGYRNREFGRRLSVKEFLDRVNVLGGIKLITPHEDYRNKHTQKLEFRCDEHQHSFFKTLGTIESCPLCPICHPKESKGQIELYEFVKGLDTSARLSDRETIGPKELDVLVPNKLAVEYDGCYWHSEVFLPSEYATQKMEACDTIGLPLLRVFDDEWRDKRSIVEGMIRHRLRLDPVRIGARECTVMELTPGQRRVFIESTHIDGDVSATKAWGLEHGGKIVAALSVRKPFHKKHAGCLEVARFCVSHGMSVIGGLSRLSTAALTYAKKSGCNSLMTYVDRRIGNAKGYVRAGFTHVAITAPRFWWTDGQRRYDRFRYRADAKRGMSELEVAIENCVVKVWGCPNVLLMLT